MLLRDLTKVWITEYTTTNNHGEKSKTWTYKGIAYLNLQQDLSELDRNTAGEVDYDILNARTDKTYDIEKGNGISLSDISESLESENTLVGGFVPDYKVTDNPKIGSTTLYKLEKYYGD